MKDAFRCLNCRNPKCVNACPLKINIPKVLEHLRNHNYQQGLDLILEKDPLPYLTCYLCNHYCQNNCVLPNKIPFWEIKAQLANSNYLDFNKTVAIDPLKASFNISIIGAGVSGLTIAWQLINLGFKVNLYEQEDQIGGTVAKHIPKFRFDYDFSSLLSFLNRHANIYLNHQLGQNLTYSQLINQDVIVLALGTTVKNFLGFNHPQVINALDYLKNYNQLKRLPSDQLTKHQPIINQKVLVIGAGNVAMDVARSLKRDQNQVTVVYRRILDFAPVNKSELNHANSEGVEFIELLSPSQLIIVDDQLKAMRFQKMKVTDYQNKEIKPIDDQYQDLDCDYVVLALGEKPQKNLIPSYYSPNLTLNQIYLAGDFKNGASTVVEAIKGGLEVVDQITTRYQLLTDFKNNLPADLTKRGILYGGSFNPFTKAHLIIIDFLYRHLTTNLTIIPQGDHYQLKELTSFEQRVEIISQYLNQYPLAKLSRYEQDNPFLGTIKTLEFFNHPYFVIGSDALEKLPQWINASQLISENNFIVIPRAISYQVVEAIIDNNQILANHKNNFIIAPLEIDDISSTQYRLTNNQELLP